MNVPIRTSHPLEVRAWACPNGSRLVELVDQSEETWKRYCADLARRNQKRVDIPLSVNLSLLWELRNEKGSTGGV